MMITPITMFLFGLLSVRIGDQRYTVLLIPAIFLILYGCFLVVLLIGFSRRKWARNFLLNNLLLFASTLILLVGLKLVDLVVGRFMTTEDLIFLPNSTAVYDTPEFTYTAVINRLGFRGDDPETGLRKNTLKVLLLGDSFTFGWGLKLEDTFPVQAQRILKERNDDVHFFNLGKPGSNPIEYVFIADRAIPELHPDLVIVNVTQGDDLFQIAPKKVELPLGKRKSKTIKNTFSALLSYFKKVFPNIEVIFFGGGIFGGKAIALAITPDWEKQSREIYQSFNAEQKKRFDDLDTDIRRMFFNGWLNPKLVYDAVLVPERFFYHEDLQNPHTQRAVQILFECLSKIKRIAQKNGADVIVALVPTVPYVDETRAENMREMGYEWDDRLLSSFASEEAVKSAAQRAGLPFYSAVEDFRQHCNENLYYNYDSHFNPRGAQRYSEFIADIIDEHLHHLQTDSAYVRP